MMVSDRIAIGFSIKHPRGDTNLPFGVEKIKKTKRKDVNKVYAFLHDTQQRAPDFFSPFSRKPRYYRS